jgi:adenylate kinase
MTNLLIVGPPGAGKGMQACLLADTADMVNVSTGDMFHEHVTNLTALGVEAKAYMDTGKYAPDDLTGRMLSDRIADLGPDNGLILDGFPGTTAQFVSSMTSSTAGASPRPRGRARCTDRGRRAARRAARASVEGRTDDNATVVRRRHEVYAEQTAPLVDRYRAPWSATSPEPRMSSASRPPSRSTSAPPRCRSRRWAQPTALRLVSPQFGVSGVHECRLVR